MDAPAAAAKLQARLVVHNIGLRASRFRNGVGDFGVGIFKILGFRNEVWGVRVLFPRCNNRHDSISGFLNSWSIASSSCWGRLLLTRHMQLGASFNCPSTVRLQTQLLECASSNPNSSTKSRSSAALCHSVSVAKSSDSVAGGRRQRYLIWWLTRVQCWSWMAFRSHTASFYQLELPWLLVFA